MNKFDGEMQNLEGFYGELRGKRRGLKVLWEKYRVLNESRDRNELNFVFGPICL